MTKYNEGDVYNYLMEQISDRQEFISKVESLMNTDWNKSPEDMYKLSMFLGFDFEHDEAATYLLFESAKRGYLDPTGNQLYHIKKLSGYQSKYKAALELAKYGAAKGYPWAYELLGDIYSCGRGVPIDQEKAAKYYSLANNKNLASSVSPQD